MVAINYHSTQQGDAEFLDLPVAIWGHLSCFTTIIYHYTVEEARANNKVVLVHCMAGISRSVTITIAYLMKYHRMSVHRAYQYLKDMRPAISPNLNFMGQLIEFERSLELGNDQRSPQIMSSDPLVATTTSSPDVTTPSKVRQPKQGSVYVVCWEGLNLVGKCF